MRHLFTVLLLGSILVGTSGCTNLRAPKSTPQTLIEVNETLRHRWVHIEPMYGETIRKARNVRMEAEWTYYEDPNSGREKQIETEAIWQIYVRTGTGVRRGALIGATPGYLSLFFLARGAHRESLGGALAVRTLGLVSAVTIPLGMILWGAEDRGDIHVIYQAPVASYLDL